MKIGFIGLGIMGAARLCPSFGSRRMAQTVARLVGHVIAMCRDTNACLQLRSR